jgi:hypothetical protein
MGARALTGLRPPIGLRTAASFELTVAEDEALGTPDDDFTPSTPPTPLLREPIHRPTVTPPGLPGMSVVAVAAAAASGRSGGAGGGPRAADANGAQSPKTASPTSSSCTPTTSQAPRTPAMSPAACL